jgi:hypothetical protein
MTSRRNLFRFHRQAGLLLATAASLAVLLLAQPAAAHDQNRGDERREERRPEVLSNREVREATGKTISQWAAKWWQWAFDHPEVLGDATGEFSSLGDVGGPVFFAQGSGGDPVRADVVVPGGQYILLPVATYIWTFFDLCADVDCARQIINHNFIDGITYTSVRIDGEQVHNMRSHLVRLDETNPVVFKVDAGPIQSDGYGGILDAAQGGYWLMLEPLPPGKHHVSFFTTIPNIDGFTGELLNGYIDLDAKLKLQAKPRKKH